MLFEIEHEMLKFDGGVSRLKHKPVLRAAVQLRETNPFCGESLISENTQGKDIGQSILLDST